MLKVKPPETNKQLYTFLCSMTFYRTCIPNYGDLTDELYTMCQSKKKFCVWTPRSLKAFTTLKQALVQAPILAFPDYTLPFLVHSDASNIGIAAVLLQRFAKILRPIAFAGRRLTKTERRYTVSERELLAVVYAYDQFYHYVYGRTIKFCTDHKPSVTMNQLKKPFGRLGRLFFRLTGVDYSMEYIPGAENYLADFLSRNVDMEPTIIEANLTAMHSYVDWLNEQAKDEEIIKVVECINSQAGEDSWNKI